MTSNQVDAQMGTVSPEESANVPAEELTNAATIKVQDRDESPWLGTLIRGTSILLVAIVTLTIYHFAVVSPSKQKIAVVDIAEVITLKELQITVSASQKGTEKGAETFDEIANFASDIEAAITDIQQECGCSLFVKAAVVRLGSAEDLTPLLKQRLRMDKLDQTQLIQQLRSMGGRGKPPLLEAPK